MSGFQNNVISNDGRSLIASATAADPIIMVGFVASATAYTALQLESATLADFEITGGTIKSCNAEGLIARIIGTIKNQPSVVTAKSFAVVARRSSQSAASNIILASVSDPNANIRIPSTSEPSVGINVPVNITTALSGTVQVVSGSAAAPSDLERFVSMFSAGNPNEGDEQHVKGLKHFDDGIETDSLDVVDECILENNVIVGGDITLDNGVVYLYSGNVVVHDGTASTADRVYIKKNNISFDSYKNQSTFTIDATLHGTGELSRVDFAYNTDNSSRKYGELTLSVEAPYYGEDTFIQLSPKYDGTYSNETSHCEFRVDQILLNSCDILPKVTNSMYIGGELKKFKNIYSTTFTGDLSGRIPYPTHSNTSTQTIPVGGLVLCYVSSGANLNSLEVGEVFTISSPSSNFTTASNSWGSSWSGNKNLGAGTYRALSDLQGGSPTEGIVLVMRIS